MGEGSLMDPNKSAQDYNREDLERLQLWYNNEIMKSNPNRTLLKIAGAVVFALAISKRSQAPAAAGVGVSYLDQQGAPRGIRNNNPGNIRKGTTWRGSIGDDGAFVRFENYVYGVRAIARILQTYKTRHGIKSLATLAARWAPASDGNQPDKYADYLATVTGINKTAQIDLADYNTAFLITRGITAMENGAQYKQTITPEVFRAAWQLI